MHYIANKKIKLRRIELGLTDKDVADKSGLSIHEYDDIEQHADEIYTVTELKKIKAICSALNLDFFDLCNIKCAFEEGQSFSDEFLLPRNELIAKRIIKSGLSKEGFGDRIGFYAEEILKLEQNPDHLETWRLENIKELSKLLEIPLQILLSIRCKKCGK